jgi:FkbM family methyltransferase
VARLTRGLNLHPEDHAHLTVPKAFTSNRLGVRAVARSSISESARQQLGYPMTMTSPAARPWGQYRPQGLLGAGIVAAQSRLARGPVYRFLKRWIMRQQTIFDIFVSGLRMRCTVADNATERRFLLNGIWEGRAQRRHLFCNLEAGGTFVDLGANCGGYSLFAARIVGPRGRVLAVEPARVMAHRLRFNVAANGFENVSVFESAVGEKCGHVRLSVDAAQRGQSSLAADVGAAERVPITTLLKIVQTSGLDRIDALKIDIEGYEDRALIPFLESAPRSLWPRRILMETRWAERWERDCFAALKSAGYSELWKRAPDCLFVLDSSGPGHR